MERASQPGKTLEPLLTVPEAARLLGISKALTWRLSATGELPTVKIAGRRLVEPDSIRDFLDAHRHRKDDNGPAGIRAEVTTSAEDGGGVDEA
jgi:excisionase family DNA binding protein